MCGGGTLVDTRTILTEAMHGGTPCDPESDMRVQECNTDACPRKSILRSHILMIPYYRVYT
jgi:hypothetical protein